MINATRSLCRKYLMRKHKMESAVRQRGAVWAWIAVTVALLAVIATAAGLALIRHLSADLPSVSALRELQLSEPMRVFTAEGALMAEFGSERRSRIAYEDIPPILIQAFLAAEDERFMSHSGVDVFGLIRAALMLARTGEKAQGGSTITMQLARNVFLTSEKTYTRKLREILLARKIETELSKGEILELYLNKIFLGERSYGVAAAAQVYFNRTPAELSLAEAAVLAGLPKAPSRDNPIANPERAKDRRGYVLRRMLASGFIDRATFEAATAEPLIVTPYRPAVEVDAHYAAEMARAEMIGLFGEGAYTQGLRVYTTVVRDEQAAAVSAVRKALLEYEERHGWRGPEARIAAEDIGDSVKRVAAFNPLPHLPGLDLVVVTAVTADGIEWLTREGEAGGVSAEGLRWARLAGDRTLAVGDVIRVRRVGEAWRLAQMPLAQSAFVALDPRSGAIVSLVGGYDFFASKFNRAAQGQRQAGSSFKPFLYAAAMEAGYSPATVMLDAPVVFDDPLLEAAWRPRNFSGKFYGPTRLREALVHSRNLVTIRLLQAVGLNQARAYAARFGLPIERQPKDLTMALGSAIFTPLELAQAYAVLANGGHRVSPFLIDRVEAADGRVLLQPPHLIVCDSCAPPLPAHLQLAELAIDPTTAWLVTDMLRDVTRRGTAARVRELGRSDLAGKTGTTNDETDAWFCGYNDSRVGVSWVGHDQPQSLGRGEVGGRAALPIWMDYMRVALRDQPERAAPPPAGVVNVRIDPETGHLATAATAGARLEFVPASALPKATSVEDRLDTDSPRSAVVEDLF